MGYEAPVSSAFDFRVEVEGIYQPQEFKVVTTSSPAFGPITFPLTSGSGLQPDLVHIAKENDWGVIANFGYVLSQAKLKPALMIGIGRNSSFAASSSTLLQVKGGASWRITDAASLTAEARYLSVSGYSADGSSFGPYSVGHQYDFGIRYSVSGTIGVRVRF